MEQRRDLDCRSLAVLSNRPAAYRKDFEEITESPSWIAHVRVASGGGRWDDGPSYNNFDEADAAEKRDNTAIANDAKTKLVAWLDGLLELHDDVPNAPNALDRVREIIHRIPSVVRVLATRRKGRPALTLDDEYDLQYVLHALLAVAFHDIRPEEWTPSYAGLELAYGFPPQG